MSMMIIVDDSYEQENIGGSIMSRKILVGVTTMFQVLSAGAMMVTPDSRYSLVNINCKSTN